MPSSYDTVEDLLASFVEEPVDSIDATKISDYPLEGGSGGSVQNRARVKLKNGQVLDLFLKIISEGSDGAFQFRAAYEYDKFLYIYDKEKTFYSEILPEMMSFQAEKIKGVSTRHSLKNLFPKYYGSGQVGKSRYLVFEDFMKNSSFAVTGAEEFHSCDKIITVLGQLGGFHAVSHAMKQSIDKPFNAKFPILQEHLMHPDNKKKLDFLFQNMFTDHLHLMDSVRKQFQLKDPVLSGKPIERVCSEGVLAKVKLYAADDLTDIMYKVLASEEPTALIAHGDFHMWNIAFSGGEVKLFDLQMVRYSSGLTDIHHYLSQVSTPQARENHLEEFLAAYQDGFDRASDDMGVPRSSVYTKIGIIEEYKKRAPWGLLMGFCFILPKFVKDQAGYQKAKKLEDAKDVVDQLDKCGPNIWWAVQVLFDLLEEMDNLGTFEVMEKERMALKSQ